MIDHEKLDRLWGAIMINVGEQDSLRCKVTKEVEAIMIAV